MEDPGERVVEENPARQLLEKLEEVGKMSEAHFDVAETREREQVPQHQEPRFEPVSSPGLDAYSGIMATLALVISSIKFAQDRFSRPEDERD